MVDQSSNGHLTLVEMKKGETGRVVSINGGMALNQRLEALGIRPGRELVKLSRAFRRGPVTVKVGSSRVAVGYGMAGKILVEPAEGPCDASS